jgi:hypothetical protein
MDVLTFETRWALNNEILKQVTSSWSLFIQLSLYDSRKTSPRGTQLTVFNTSRLAPHNYLNKWAASCVFLKGHGLHSRKTETNRIVRIAPWAQLFSKTLLAGGVTVQGDKSQTYLREICANETEGCLTYLFGDTC